MVNLKNCETLMCDECIYGVPDWQDPLCAGWCCKVSKEIDDDKIFTLRCPKFEKGQHAMSEI